MSTATKQKPLKLFVRLTKIDEATRTVYGRATDETVDSVSEVMDYTTSKPLFEAWSSHAEKVTDGKSKGNLRAMHGKVAAGKLEQILFDDTEKAIDIGAKVVDDNEWAKCLEGVYTGFSIGGSYAKKWKDGSVYRFTCDPVEISLVDLPCNPNALFETVKADGSVVQKHFQPGSDLVAAKVLELAKAAGVEDLAKAAAQFEGPARTELAKTIHDPALIVEVAEAPIAPAAVVEPTNEQIVAKASELAKTKGGSWTSHTDEARTALLAAQAAPGAAETPPAAALGAAVEKIAPAAAAAPGAGDGDWEQVWASKRLPGQTFKKKGELQAALVALDATEKAAKAAAPVADALGRLRDQIGGVTVSPAADLLKAHVDKAIAAKAKANEAAIQKAAGITPEAWAIATAWALANPQHALVKALAGVSVKYNLAGEVLEVPADAVAALKALSDQATKTPAPTADELAAMVKAGEARGVLVLKTVEDLDDALANYEFGPSAKRFFIKRAKALKAADKIPADWQTSPAAIAADAGPELKKGATLYGLCRMIELLASLQSCEDGIERNDIYCGVPVPAEMSTRFGTMLVDFGDLVADLLDVILQQIRDEESGEAMTRSAAARDLLKGLQLAGDTLTKFAAPGALAKLAPIGGDVETVEKLTARLDAQENAFTKTVGTFLEAIDDVTKRLKAVEDTPLAPGASSVNDRGRALKVADKGDDSPVPAGPALTPEQVLSDPTNLAKLADIAIRSAHARPIHAVPAQQNPTR